MSRNFRAVALIGLALCWPTLGAVRAGEGPTGPRLKSIIARYWEDQIRTQPIEATIFVGDQSHSGELDDPSAEAYRAWLDRLRATHLELTAIDLGGLNSRERIDREILMKTIDSRLEAVKFGDHLIPFAPIVRYTTDLHFDDLHLLFAQLGEFQPAASDADLEKFLSRLKSFPAMADRLIAILKQGITENRMPPKVGMAKVVAQLRGLSKPHARASPLWSIVARFPAGWTQEHRQEMTNRVERTIEVDVVPAYARLADFVEKTYLPRCRDSVGLCATSDGGAHYAFLVRWYTTTDLSPNQIHDLGRAEMAKNRAGMESIRKKVGFSADLKAFFTHVRADPRFKNRTERRDREEPASIVQAHPFRSAGDPSFRPRARAIIAVRRILPDGRRRLSPRNLLREYFRSDHPPDLYDAALGVPRGDTRPSSSRGIRATDARWRAGPAVPSLLLFHGVR
jgi:uncharacterized protein (DUF885 family)